MTRNRVIALGVLAIFFDGLATADAQFSGQLPPSTVLGNATASKATAVPVPATNGTILLTGGAIAARAATTSVSGIVPASGGGTSNFLRADFTWASIPSACSTLGAFGVIWENASNTGCTADATHLYWTPTDSVTTPAHLTIDNTSVQTTGINGAIDLDLIGGNDSVGGALRARQTALGGSLRAGYYDLGTYAYIDGRDASEAVGHLVLNGGGAAAGAPVSVGTSLSSFVSQSEFGMMPVSLAGVSQWWIPLGSSGSMKGGLFNNASAEPELRFGTNFKLSSGAAVASYMPYRLGLGGVTAPATDVDAAGSITTRAVTSCSAGNALNTDSGGKIVCGAVSGGAGGITGTVVNGEVVKGTGASTVATTGITLPSAPASTQCLHMSSGGAITATGTDCNTGAGGGSTGLFSQVLSATPTSSSTGFNTWLNQGGASVADAATGLSLTSPSNGATVTTALRGRTKTAPGTPYTATVLFALNAPNTDYVWGGFGWYDGTNKLHVIEYYRSLASPWSIDVRQWATPTSAGTVETGSTVANLPASSHVWLQVVDDGTNAVFKWSVDGSNYMTLFTVAKASGYLGSSGYTNLVFFTNAQTAATPVTATLLSYTQG